MSFVFKICEQPRNSNICQKFRNSFCDRRRYKIAFEMSGTLSGFLSAFFCSNPCNYDEGLSQHARCHSPHNVCNMLIIQFSTDSLYNVHCTGYSEQYIQCTRYLKGTLYTIQLSHNLHVSTFFL